MYDSFIVLTICSFKCDPLSVTCLVDVLREGVSEIFSCDFYAGHWI